MQVELNRETIMQILGRELPHLQREYGVVRLALYGSFAKGKANRRSDVDLLVELSRPLGLEFVDLAEYLQKELGRNVHLTTFATLERSQQSPRYQHITQDVQETLIDVQPQTR